MPLLVRHPDTPEGAITGLVAELERTSDGVLATFRAVGDISRLRVPAPAPSEHRDELWRTTCFELFVGGDGPDYREYNLSPSGAWAAYAFDGYRQGMRAIPAGIDIQIDRNDKALTMIAKIMTEIANPARVGLSAVVEESDGAIRYWATAFAPGRPDFHQAAVRSLLLDGVDAS